MRKICNLVVFLMLIFLLSSCQAITTETEAETNANIITTTETKTYQNTENQTTLSENLIFDWIEVKSLLTNEKEYSPKIFYVTTDENVNLSEIDWDSQNYSNLNHFVNNYESKQDAIEQYENEIGKFYFKRNPGVSGVGEYQKSTIIGYELVTYELKLYKTNYLEIKTIKYNNSDNSIAESITGFNSNLFYIEFYDITSNRTTNTEYLINDWKEIKRINTFNTDAEPKISYLTTKQEITENEYGQLKRTKTSANLSNNLNQFESKQDAIEQYENEIGHYYFEYDSNYKYYKCTITGYELTTYEVKLYKSNYSEIKTIKYNSSNNSVSESVVGILYADSVITFCE